MFVIKGRYERVVLLGRELELYIVNYCTVILPQGRVEKHIPVSYHTVCTGAKHRGHITARGRRGREFSRARPQLAYQPCTVGACSTMCHYDGDRHYDDSRHRRITRASKDSYGKLPSRMNVARQQAQVKPHRLQPTSSPICLFVPIALHRFSLRMRTLPTPPS